MMLKTLLNLCAAIFAIGLVSALSGCADDPAGRSGKALQAHTGHPAQARF